MIDARYDPDASEAPSGPFPSAGGCYMADSYGNRYWVEGLSSIPAALAATMLRDLRTADQRARDDITALALRCDSLAEQLAVAARQIGALEERERAHAAAIERLADAVQALILRGGV